VRGLLGALLCAGTAGSGAEPTILVTVSRALRAGTVREIRVRDPPDRYGPGVNPVGADSLLADLDDEQRQAVTATSAPLAVLAGAGSGKTRVLTRRIAWQCRTGAIDGDHVLAVTFTRKAAGELETRLARLGTAGRPAAGTLHAVALAQLRRRNAGLGKAMPEVLDRKVRLLVRRVGGRGPEAALAAAEVAAEIEWAKARLVRPDGYAVAVADAGRTPPRPPSEIAAFYEWYEREKRRRRVVDFDDLVWWCADALESDAEFAAAQRWRFRHFFVDEFQDTTPAQLRLIRAWLGDRNDLCVVGDPDQAVYGFAGADAGYLRAFGRSFPGGHVVRLVRNYRSTPEIVAAGDAVLADGDRRCRPHQAVAGPGAVPVIRAYDDGAEEAREVAGQILAARARGVDWSRIAVLYRTNAQSAAFEAALRAADIPFRVRGAARFLDRPEVKAALDTLGDTARRSPGRAFPDLLVDLAARDSNSDERREHIDALARIGAEYAEIDGARASVSGFRAYLTTVLRDDAALAGGDAVELLTFHRAKGLEFDTVLVTGLERGYVPIAHAETPAERAEERRLLYVAITRAERTLQLSHARQRSMGLRVSRRVPSPWLGPIEAALAERSDEAPGPHAGLAAARQRLAASDRPGAEPAPDPGLLEALTEWRRRMARAAGVPAYVIFHDTTLREVATTRPASRTALLAVTGIGPVKAERHGEALLDLVRRHQREPERARREAPVAVR
jgi:DNA helicase-2/ATP-dependent DNA helicase PcrA